MMWWIVALIVAVTGAINAVGSFFFMSSDGHAWAWAAGWAALTLVTLVLAWRNPRRGFLPFLVSAVLWAGLWMAIQPTNQGNWEAEYSRQPSGELSGSTLTIKDLRNFDWQASGQAVERWETRTYDLDKLTHIDLIASYWSGPTMAHLMLSFGFEGAEPLAMSVETRREKGEAWSAVAGFFRAYELAYVAADERDVVRLRTSVRKEDVRLYRLKASTTTIKRLLLQYVAEMNGVHQRPRFYHTIWTNCTTQIVRIAREAGHRFPFDWRLIASGYVPDYLYELGILSQDLPLADLKARAAISAKGQAASADPAFSARIREGLVLPK